MSRNYSLLLCCLLCLGGGARVLHADPTPPIMPTLVETPLPPVVSLPAPDVLPAELPNRPLTAAEAAAIALHRQPTVSIALANAQAAQARLQQAKAGLRPGIVVSGGYSDTPLTVLDGAGGNTGFTAGLTLRQLLFDYEHTRALVQQATAQHQAARANLTRAQSDLVLQTKLAFYTLAQQERLVSVNTANLSNRQQHLTLAQARVQSGLGLPVDVVRAETAVADAALTLNQAQNAAAISRITLALLMGIDPRTPLQVDEEGEAAGKTDDINALLTIALARRPEITQAQSAVQAAQFGTRAAISANAPMVVGSLGWGMRDQSFPPRNASLTYGVAVQWNAFDSGLTAGRVTEANANLQAAQAQLAATTLTVTADVSQAYLNAKTAEQRLATATAGMANAEEGVRLAQGRYAAGIGVFLDVLDAQNALVTAQTNRVNAQSAINQARATLAHAFNSDPILLQQ